MGTEKICESILIRKLNLVVEEVEVSLIVTAMKSGIRRGLEDEPRRKEVRDERLLKSRKHSGHPYGDCVLDDMLQAYHKHFLGKSCN